MLDLILKLIDRLIDLAKRREEVNRVLFNEFVQPAFNDVEALYKDYVESLKRYRDAAVGSPDEVNASASLIADVANDRRFAEQLIIRVRQIEDLDDLDSLEVGEFLNAIAGLLEVRIVPTTGADFYEEEGEEEGLPQNERAQISWPDHMLAWPNNQIRGDVGEESFEGAKFSTPRTALIQTFSVEMPGLIPPPLRR